MGHIESRIEIYSLSNDYWKAVRNGQKINFYLVMPSCSFIVKGDPYWDNGECFLGAFDPLWGCIRIFCIQGV